jgi:undecaprenyl diphosphate synthase
MPRWKGHEMGAKAVRRVSEAACRQQIAVLTLFAFSSENWKRPAQEVHILFTLLRRYLLGEKARLLENDIRLSAIGRRERIPEGVLEALREVEEATRHGRRLHLRLALDYGARQEIVDAARLAAHKAQRGELNPETLTEQAFEHFLSGEAVCEPDLIIRTAGERRLSNFLLWQAAYSELYFCPKLWPDFEEQDLTDALADYRNRTRKWGSLVEQAGRTAS